MLVAQNFFRPKRGAMAQWPYPYVRNYVLSGKIIAQHDYFCSQATLGIKNPDLRTRRFVIGQSKKAHLSPRLH